MSETTFDEQLIEELFNTIPFFFTYKFAGLVNKVKLNVKNLNFEEENILPGEDGNLYLINSKKEKFTLLNYTIKDIVNNEILTFEKEKKNFFTKKKIIHSFGIDFFSGKIKNQCG